MSAKRQGICRSAGDKHQRRYGANAEKRPPPFPLRTERRLHPQDSRLTNWARNITPPVLATGGIKVPVTVEIAQSAAIDRSTNSN
jgi:hypothetical protein